MKRRVLLSLPFLFLRRKAVSAPPEHKAETIGECQSSEVSDAMKRVLQPEGLQVKGEAGVFCEIWLRKVIPQKPGSSGTDYNTLEAGAFAGIIVYSSRGGDYRGQAIKPGVYSLRYLTMPADGNHMGASPTPNYFMLAPAGMDKDPDAVIGYDDLVKLSAKAAGTSHPSALYLETPTGGGKPAFRQTDDDHSVLETKTKAQPAGGAEIDFPLAINLIGKGAC